MRMPRITRRWVAVAVSVVALVLAAWGVGIWYVFRAVFRGEASYNALMRQINIDYEIRLRERIEFLLYNQKSEPAGRETTDGIFEMLNMSRVAGNSREVRSWRDAPHSPERSSIALKWGKVAADEAAYEAALCARWTLDFEQGRMPHHITDDEVRPFRMPAGWTKDDLIGNSP